MAKWTTFKWADHLELDDGAVFGSIFWNADKSEFNIVINQAVVPGTFNNLDKARLALEIKARDYYRGAVIEINDLIKREVQNEL